MTNQLPTSEKTEHLEIIHQQHFPILSTLLALDAFVLGGLVALFGVYRLLDDKLPVYSIPRSMAAAEAILSLMDDLIPYLVVCSVILVTLVLLTISAWVWSVTKSRLLRYGVVLLALVFVAAGAWAWLGRMSSSVRPMVPTPTNLPISTPTPVSMVHPPGTRTGVGEVDAVIDAILANDVEARRELVRYTTTGCTTKLGMGGPPKCKPSELDGTLVEVFPFLGPEGEYVRPEAIDRILQFAVEGLYAVYQVPDNAYKEAYWPAGRYGIVFVGTGMHPQVTVLVEDDGIVRIDFSSRTPAMVIEQEAGKLLLPPVAGTR